MGAVGHTFSDFSCFVALRNMMIFWASLLELKVDDGTGGVEGGPEVSEGSTQNVNNSAQRPFEREPEPHESAAPLARSLEFQALATIPLGICSFY